ncbi:Heterokaryon incompatibility protein 6, OR allele [Pseudocercospora fuligena]|uniref:Heterokaryon incompatibility protein 6, OR allele n=1 Tax=Pseudocercospora fuligena TaxID=685502 RepID=A0A8H6RP83_9PEZI|nr:Heterokaryon incompatibility protein 6, OR allele [Pseudocercospora fuligena]
MTLDVSTDKEYIYNYLSDENGKSIRLLTILPGAAADPVFVKIEEFHLDEDWDLVVDYVALSYTWDSPGAEKRVHIGEHGEEGFMLVRPNVDSALRKLRSSADEEHHVVWIDAICIDQNDDDEKMKQVAMMGEIYSKARGTVIWLGDADDRTELGLRACDVLAKAYWKMTYGDEMDEDAAGSGTDSWETESTDSMDIVGMNATKTVKAILGDSNRSRPTSKAKGKKRKREDDAEKERRRIREDDLSSLL